jgi:hypothetical protein
MGEQAGIKWARLNASGITTPDRASLAQHEPRAEHPESGQIVLAVEPIGDRWCTREELV